MHNIHCTSVRLPNSEHHGFDETENVFYSNTSTASNLVSYIILTRHGNNNNMCVHLVTIIAYLRHVGI